MAKLQKEGYNPMGGCGETVLVSSRKSVAYFIKQLFDINRNIPNVIYPNIELVYCKDYLSAKVLLQKLSIIL